MTQAPFFTEIADGPVGGHALWFKAQDGVKLRAGLWPDGEKGTVFLLPGRSEYVEKYGRAAEYLRRRGFATIAIDWRGQGLADRAFEDRMIGHVDDFAEYQLDLDALLALADSQSMPQPYYLLCHSMGGCIGLRALMRNLPFKAATFSSPMWGISMAAWMRPLAQVISSVSGWVGQAHRYAPGTGGQTYVLEAQFQGNVLTTDHDMWSYMQRQVGDHPDLGLGGPSLGWLKAALNECGALSMMSAPSVPAVTSLGTAEKVVDAGSIHMRMATWPGGRLDMYAGAEHEVIMETPEHRARFFDAAAALFEANP